MRLNSLIVRILASVLLLVALLWVVLDPEAVAAASLQVDGLLLSLAAALATVGIGIQWLKWHSLLAHGYPNTARVQSLYSLLVGMALGLVSPGRIGELGRGVLIGGYRLEAVALCGLDRLISALVTLAAAAVGLAVLEPLAGVSAGVVVAGVVAASYRVAVCGLKSPLVQRMMAHLAEDSPWRRHLERGSAALRNLPAGLWRRTILLSVLFNLVFFFQFYVLSLSWIDLPARGVAAIPLIFALKALAPIGFLDVGVREAASVLVFSLVGLDPVPALWAALLLWLLNVVIPSAVGLVWVAATRVGWPVPAGT